jgi:catechol 2,3-dioxygenase-like lactoylglutathione lyase family enzyme
MAPTIEKISAITLRVLNMKPSVQFYRNVLGMKLLKDRGFNPEIPRDASWGERYFHMLDPDGHELSFAQPLQ